MSGELDTRPNLTAQIRELRDKIRDLESRSSGDEQGFDLSDLNDVRVDSMVDPAVTLNDGSALVYRASDNIWVPGGSSDPNGFDYLEAQDDGTHTSNASNAQTELTFTVVSGNTSGTDIGITAGEIVIATDGIYAFSCDIHMESNNNSDTFDEALGFLNVSRAVRGDVNLRDYRVPIVIGGPKHYTQLPISWAGFMTAGDKFRVYGEMVNGGASTWTGDAYAFVQRIV